MRPMRPKPLIPILTMMCFINRVGCDVREGEKSLKMACEAASIAKGAPQADSMDCEPKKGISARHGRELFAFDKKLLISA